MKRFLLLSLLLIPGLLQAADKYPSYNQDHTVSNHSLMLNLLGLTYSYEQALSRRTTIQFSAGAAYSFGQILGIDFDRDYGLELTTRDYHLVRGIITAEPRFYYNLPKRFRKEKNTCGNSGGYLSVELGYSFPIAVSSGIEGASLYSMTPYWGFRRVWWKHFLFDLSGGLSFMASSNKTQAIFPTLRLGLGYRF